MRHSENRLNGFAAPFTYSIRLRLTGFLPLSMTLRLVLFTFTYDIRWVNIDAMHVAQVALLASNGVASLAAMLQQCRKPAVLAATLAALSAFVRGAIIAAGATGNGGSRTATAVASSTSEAGHCGRTETAASGDSGAGRRVAEPRGGLSAACVGVPAQQRPPSLPGLLALDDALVTAIVRVLRQRGPDGGLDPDLALQALQLITSIVVAKASTRQLLR